MAWLCDTRELYPDKVHARGRWAHPQAWIDGALFGDRVDHVAREDAVRHGKGTLLHRLVNRSPRVRFYNTDLVCE